MNAKPAAPINGAASAFGGGFNMGGKPPGAVNGASGAFGSFKMGADMTEREPEQSPSLLFQSCLSDVMNKKNQNINPHIFKRPTAQPGQGSFT